MMKRIIKNVYFILVVVSLVLGYSFAASVKTLNTNLAISNINSSQANSYWQTCLGESNNDDNLRKAYYVGNSVSPRYGYSYSSSNPNWARSVLDTTTMYVYNPGTFVNNGTFTLLSNMCPNGGNVKITRPIQDIEIVDNTVGRSNMAGLYVLGGKYQTMLLGSNNSSNFLGYRLDYFQNTPLYVHRNYSLVNSPVNKYSCAAYYVAKCGDGVVDNVNKVGSNNTDGKYGILVGGDIVQWAGGSPHEVCDDGNLNGQEGHCNLNCDGYVGQTQAPTCALNVVNNGGVYDVDWIITGTFDSPTQITVVPNTINQTSHTVSSNIGTWTNLVPTGYGTYNVSMTVSNSAGSNTCTDSFYVAEPQTKVCGDGNIDLPNDSGVYEECDDGNTNNSDACNSNCELATPVCSITVSPTTQVVGGVVTFSASKDSWASYKSLNFDDGNTIWNSNINFPYDYAYSSVGFFDPVLKVENAYSPIAAGVVRPTNICGVSLDINPAPANVSIDKILLSTGNLSIGDLVDYQIVLTNNADTVLHDAYILDVMPGSLDLVSTNLIGVYPYNYAQWQDGSGNWFFEYSGFDLNPGQSVTVNLRGQIRQGASSNDTTNCAFTENNMVDCEMYNLAPEPYILKSQSVSNNVVYSNFTTGLVYVNPGDYVTYRIDFANVGGSNTNGGVHVRDYMPLCVDYVSSAIYGVSSSASFSQSQDLNGRWIIDYDNFDLYQGQDGYMIVTGQIMNAGVCANVDTYTNNSYIYFNNPLMQQQSNVTAQRATHSIVNLTKTSNTSQNIPGDDKLFTITVENAGPNPITNLVLKDIWPSGTCVSYVDWTGAGWTKDPSSLLWTNPITLGQGDSVVLYISGSIANNPACENPDYINKVNLKYTELGNIYEDNAECHFAVGAAPSANISLIKTADVSSVTSGSNITYTISYQNVGNTTLNSYVISDIWPQMVDFVSASPSPTNILSFLTGDVYQWNFNSPLLPGQTGEIILHGIVQ